MLINATSPIHDFMNFINKKKLCNIPCRIVFLPDFGSVAICDSYNYNDAENVGFAVYYSASKTIYIAGDLSGIDDLQTEDDKWRTILTFVAHEYTHHLQNIEGRELNEDEADKYAEELVEEYYRNLNDEIIQYFIVNKELNMTPGKIAAQIAHVTVEMMLDKDKIVDFEDWYYKYNQKKIILKGKQKDLEKLVKQGFYHIKDLGLTEIPKESLTAVGLYPMCKSVAQKYIKRFQLL